MAIIKWDSSIDLGILALGEAFIDFLSDWLIRHIKGTDQAFSSFMLEKKRAAKVVEQPAAS